MTLETATTLRPTGLAEVRQALLDTAGPVLFRGAGSKLTWGRAPADVAAVIASGGMREVRSYNPADATVAVQAGIPLADLQEVLSEHDQWLAIDPPDADPDADITVGGVFAANDSGPRRLRYGTMRDLVIGATFVLSDGTVGRTGGFVIKNVAGYDMAKLLCGSLGTLAFVAELVLRVHPRPPASVTLRIPADIATATRMSTRLGAAPVEPVAVEWAEHALWVQLAGHADAIADQAARLPAVIAGADGPQPDVDIERFDGHEEAAAWDRLTAALAGADGETVVRAACLPTDLPTAIDGLARAADRVGIGVEVSAHALLGVMTARLSGGAPDGHAACVSAWRDALRPLAGHAVVRRHGPQVEGVIDVWGPPPSAIGLMRQVKAHLDPDNRCAPGRFVGGI